MNFEKLIKTYKRDMELALAKIVSFPSVLDEQNKDPKTPYGKATADALNYMAFLGESYGFDVDKCDGRCTELSLGKEGKIIGIFSHIDVVPVNEKNWSSNPFRLTRKDGVYYGRGVTDDKGPAIAAFYSVKALKDNGLIPNNVRIRLVFGGNEEKGSTCVKYYFENLKKEDPDYAFTPDADFPLIYGEKGITHFQLVSKKDCFKNIVSIEGGTAGNIVMDSCTFVLKDSNGLQEKLKENKVDFTLEGKNLVCVFKGKSAHGSVPDLGENAFVKGCKVLGPILDETVLKGFAEAFQDNHGKGFDAYDNSPVLKETTYNVGIVSYKNGKFDSIVDFRYGENVTAPREFMDKLAKKVGLEVKFDGEPGKHLLVDKNSKLVKTLMQAYSEENDSTEQPITIGGGTYAKEIKNCVAFGPERHGSVYKIHEEDERLPIEEFYKMAATYARAIYYLTRLK